MIREHSRAMHHTPHMQHMRSGHKHHEGLLNHGGLQMTAMPRAGYMTIPRASSMTMTTGMPMQTLMDRHLAQPQEQFVSILVVPVVLVISDLGLDFLHLRDRRVRPGSMSEASSRI